MHRAVGDPVLLRYCGRCVDDELICVSVKNSSCLHLDSIVACTDAVNTLQSLLRFPFQTLLEGKHRQHMLSQLKPLCCLAQVASPGVTTELHQHTKAVNAAGHRLT